MDPTLLLPMIQAQLNAELRDAILSTKALRKTSLDSPYAEETAGLALHHWRTSQRWNGILLTLIRMANDPPPQPEQINAADLADMMHDAENASRFLLIQATATSGTYSALAQDQTHDPPFDPDPLPTTPERLSSDSPC